MIATTATAAPPSTPSSDTVWAELADIDDLVEAGDRRRALSKARRLLDSVDGAAREELADLVATIEETRDAAWEARDTRQPTRWERPRNARIRRVEPQPARTTGQRADAQAARYLADQADPVEPDRRHPDDGDAYDPEAEFAAAVEPLRGAACLGCGIERSSLDRATGDGVCESCRRTPTPPPWSPAAVRSPSAAAAPPSRARPARVPAPASGSGCASSTRRPTRPTARSSPSGWRTTTTASRRRPAAVADRHAPSDARPCAPPP